MNEVAIHTYLTGVRTFLANAQQEALAVRELGVATRFTGEQMGYTTRRSWLMNQALFTARRLVYATTLGLIASSVAVVKWGNDYNVAMQGARVTLQPFFQSSQELETTLNNLWTIAKYSPFQIQDMTLAFNRMYPSMSRLGITAPEVTRTLHDLTDALTVGMAGRVTPMALNRASVALQHLAFLGRLTGMSVLQLARDGIPIYAALSKELGLSADQMHNIGKLGIPAQVALQAINRYIESTPGYANAARRLSNRSVAGLFSQLKDNLSQTMGIAERSWFHGFQRMLMGANTWFNKLQTNLKETGNLVQAIDQTLTPRSHIVMRVWQQFRGAVQDAWRIFKLLVGTVANSRAIWVTLGLSLYTIHYLLAAIYHTSVVWVPLLKVLIPLLIAWRFITWGLAATSLAYWSAQKLLITSEFALAGAMRALAVAQGIWMVLSTGSIRGANGQFIAMTRLEKIVLRLRYAFLSLTVAMETNPIILIITAVVLLTVGLVILYFKWKAFHDLVNRTARFIQSHWRWLALIPVVGPFIVATIIFIRHLRTIYHWIMLIVHGIEKIHLPHIGLPHLGMPHFFQHGGVSTGGLAVVGEAGPELLHLPRGTSVTPTRGIGSGLDGIIRIYPQDVYLQVDGRTLAEAVVRHQTAVNARA